MTLEEVIGLLAMVNSYDTRIDPTETQAAAWLAAIEKDMPLSWAAQQVIKYYGADNKFLLTVGWLNTEWRKLERTNSFFKGLPEPQGSVTDKERARWWMMQGIIEGVTDLNNGTSRDAWISPIVRERMKHGTDIKPLNYKALFTRLDWDWHEELRDTYGKRLV